MSQKIFLFILLYIAVINVITLVLFMVKDRADTPRRKRINDNLILALSVLGGGFGAVAGLMIYRYQQRHGIAKKALVLLIAWILILLILMVLCLFVFPKNEDHPEESVRESRTEAPTETAPEQTPSEEPTALSSSEEATEPVNARDGEVTLICVGDMLMHEEVSSRAKQADGSYNYDYLFEGIKDELRNADVAVVNNEIPFGGDEIGIKGYPLFNAVTALGDAEVKAGFNVILNASNHTTDQGLDGVRNTINFWKKYPEVKSIGLNETENGIYELDIIEKNGIKIALFNYTYRLNEAIKDENGKVEDVNGKDIFYVDTMMYWERDRAIMKEMMGRAEKEADITVVFPHWGVEYNLKDNEDQRNWAEIFAIYGADLIIGMHPHCLEPVREITAYTGDKALCYFSLGNYVSAQEWTSLVLGGMAQVTIVKDETGTHVKNYSLIPLVTQYDENKENTSVVKLSDYTKEMEQKHGILLRGKESKDGYPFSIASFHEILKFVGLE